MLAERCSSLRFFFSIFRNTDRMVSKAPLSVAGSLPYLKKR
jgi:hypothetical protein